MAYINLKDTKNFKVSEFMCKCKYKNCNKITDTKDTVLLIGLLQKVRDKFNESMKINCAYRCIKHNADVGGVKGSQHLQGIAADIGMPSNILNSSVSKKLEWLKSRGDYWHQICAEKGIGGGVGYYDSFIHLDCRKVKSNFDYRTKKK